MEREPEPPLWMQVMTGLCIAGIIMIGVGLFGGWFLDLK